MRLIIILTYSLVVLILGYVVIPVVGLRAGLSPGLDAANTITSTAIVPAVNISEVPKPDLFALAYRYKPRGVAVSPLLRMGGGLYGPRVLQYFSGNRIANENFEKGVARWRHWSANKDEQLQWNSRCSGHGGCLFFVASENKTSLLFSNNFKVEKNKSYLVKFRIAASFPQTRVKMRVRRDGPTYESLGLDKWLTAGIRWEEHEYLIYATHSSHIARLDLEVSAGSQILLDNVSVQEVAAEVHDPEDDSLTLVQRNNIKIPNTRVL